MQVKIIANTNAQPHYPTVNTVSGVEIENALRVLIRAYNEGGCPPVGDLTISAAAELEEILHNWFN